MNQQTQHLIDLLKSDTDKTQVDAATQLGRIADPAAIPALTEMLHGKTYALTKGEGSPGQYSYIIEGAACALGNIGTREAIEILLQALSHKTLEIQAGGALGLGYVKAKDERILPALLKLINTPGCNQYIQNRAASALGMLGDLRAVETLTQLVNKPPSWPVQLEAFEALVKLRDENSASLFSRIFHNPDQLISEAVAHPFRDDMSFTLSAIAAHGLAFLDNDPYSLNLLETAFISGEGDRQLCAAIGLAHRKDARSFDLLLAALTQTRNTVLVETSKALAFYGDPRAIPALKAVAENGRLAFSTGKAAANALHHLEHEAKP